MIAVAKIGRPSAETKLRSTPCQQHRHHREDNHIVVFVGQRANAWLLARNRHDRIQHQAQSHASRSPAITASHSAIRTDRLHGSQCGAARADGLGNQRRNCSGEAGQRPQHQPEQRHSQGRAGQLLLAKPGDEDHIDGIGQHLQQIGSRQRPREPEGRAQFLPPAGRVKGVCLLHDRFVTRRLASRPG